MGKNLPMVALGAVLRRVDRFEPRDDLKRYQFAGIYSFARGIFVSEQKYGSEFKLPKVQRIHAGDFVYSKIMAWEGAFGLVSEIAHNSVMSGAFVVYELDRSLVNPDYLDYYFKIPSVWKSIGKQSTGTNVRRRSLHPAQFEMATIPLPSLLEQQKIVARIKALLAKAITARGLQKISVKESCSLVDSATSACFSKLGAAKYKPLAEMTSKIGSGSTPKGGRAVYLEDGIPFIRSLNVRMRRFQFGEIVFIDESTHQAMKNTQVKPNDVLLNITGASIGRVACAPADLVTANVNQHVSIIRPLADLDNRFVMYWLSQPAIQDFINNAQKGATRQGFTKAQIEMLMVPVLPISKQRHIVSRLDELQSKVDVLMNLQTEVKEKVDSLMLSILNKAFNGRLLV